MARFSTLTKSAACFAAPFGHYGGRGLLVGLPNLLPPWRVWVGKTKTRWCWAYFDVNWGDFCGLNWTLYFWIDFVACVFWYVLTSLKNCQVWSVKYRVSGVISRFVCVSSNFKLFFLVKARKPWVCVYVSVWILFLRRIPHIDCEITQTQAETLTHRIHVWYIWFAIYHQYTPVMLASIYHTYGSVMGDDFFLWLLLSACQPSESLWNPVDFQWLERLDCRGSAEHPTQRAVGWENGCVFDHGLWMEGNPEIGVAGGALKSSISMGFSTTKTFFGVPPFMDPPRKLVILGIPAVHCGSVQNMAIFSD